MTDDSVLVAGGGIAGLAVARALRQRGIRTFVSERMTDAARGGLSIMLPGNAIMAFAELGLRNRLEKLGRAVHRREYRSASGRLLFEIDEDEFWGPLAQPRALRRSELLDLLDDKHEDNRRSSSVVSVRLVDGGAEATFDDGRVERHGFVIGADGVRSAVRQSVFGAHEARFAVLSAAAYRWIAPNPGVESYVGWTGEGSFLLIPLDRDEVYVFASATGGADFDATPQWLERTFGSYPEPVRAVVAYAQTHPEALHHSPIEEIRIDEWTRGRVALIGDAAHATSPMWAQGGALAVEDAVVMADTLARGDWDTAGQRYERRRRKRVDHVQLATDQFSQAVSLPIEVRERTMPEAGPKAYRAAYGPLRERLT
jgi:2-polyprenyl-6-methoxyphenol hydroxylase-like FAD-dependent oxidoreductase